MDVCHPWNLSLRKKEGSDQAPLETDLAVPVREYQLSILFKPGKEAPIESRAPYTFLQSQGALCKDAFCSIICPERNCNNSNARQYKSG